jgi:hypothetical protein
MIGGVAAKTAGRKAPKKSASSRRPIKKVGAGTKTASHKNKAGAKNALTSAKRSVTTATKKLTAKHTK